MKKTLNPEDITAIVDTREQLPYDLAPLKMIRGTLDSGDYSVVGLEGIVALERKSLPDLLGCIATGRDRFERELARLRGFDVRAVVVEASWDDLRNPSPMSRSRISPESAMGSVLGWMALGIPFLFAGDRENAEKAVSRMLFIAARRRWRELVSFSESLTGASDAPVCTSDSALSHTGSRPKSKSAGKYPGVGKRGALVST